MKQSITDFHKDEEGHWVADLTCFHTRHFRHDPPWHNREWVEDPEKRRDQVGVWVDCPKCEPGWVDPELSAP